jgi:hypothetical protein
MYRAGGMEFRRRGLEAANRDGISRSRGEIPSAPPARSEVHDYFDSQKNSLAERIFQ